MPKYRVHLPQLDGGIFLTDGGLETTLIFHDKLELPYFAAFRLLKDEAGSRRFTQVLLQLRHNRLHEWVWICSGKSDLARQS